MKTQLLLLLCWFGSMIVPAFGQADYDITPYSTADGLSHTTATCIMQDKKGQIWLSTWDGINKFDGYTFTTYKASPHRQTTLPHNRIVHLIEDHDGCFWATGYDGSASRFNPDTETFEIIALPRHFMAARTHVFHNRHLWIQSKTNEAVRLHYDTGQQRYLPDIHFKGTGDKDADKLTLYEDRTGGEWVAGRNSGIYRTAADRDTLQRISTCGAYCVLETDDHVLWGTTGGKIITWHKRARQTGNIQLPCGSAVRAMSLYEGQMVCVTESDGIFVGEKHFAPALPHRTFVSAKQDSRHRIWLTTSDARLVQFDLRTREWHDFSPSRTASQSPLKPEELKVMEDSKGNLWIYPYAGHIALWQNGKMQLIREMKKQIAWGGVNSHYVFFIDRQDNLWLSTSRWFGRISLKEDTFHRTLLHPDSQKAPEESNIFRSILQDSRHTIWTGNRAGEILLYSPRMTLQGKLMPDGSVSADRNADSYIGRAYALLEDGKGRVWIGTKGDGLWLAEPTGKTSHPYRLTHFVHRKDEPYSLNSDQIYWLQEDRHGRIWIATYERGLCYAEEGPEGTFRFIHPGNRLRRYPVDGFDKIRCLGRDAHGDIWVGTTNGILTFAEDFDTPEAIDFHVYRHQPDVVGSLSNNNVQNIILTHDRQLYIGTFGGGLCRALRQTDGTYAFVPCTPQKGIPSDIVYSIVEDHGGNLWLAGESGLNCYNPHTGTFDYFDRLQIGFPPMFNEGRAICLHDGRLAFLTLDGLLHFHPEDVRKSRDVPRLMFTSLQLGGDPIRPGTNSDILPQAIDTMKELTLPHDRNLFTLHFAALEMTNPDNVSYTYRLEGFDTGWIDAGRQRSASYTNLPTGTYTLRVRSTNGDGVWVDNERSIRIVVEPSFWETPLAWVLYVLLAVAVGYIAHKFYQLRNRVYIEQQTTRYKLRFFTDISHELRTPLTLITAPIENLLHHRDVPPFVSEQLTMISRNAEQMQHLINQILEFRKLQSNQVPMQWETIEACTFVRRIAERFAPLARERGMAFTLTTDTRHCTLQTDADKLEKVVNNLLSNAFKYTPDGKGIRVFLHGEPSQLTLRVCDEGIGIPQEEIGNLFTRFTTLHSSSVSGSPSTGIGLALVKELVAKLKGTIGVESNEGKGSDFHVSLPCCCDSFLPDPETETFASSGKPAEPAPSLPAEIETPSDPDTPTLLLVEDNDDMRLFLRGIFKDAYHVIEARQGEEGLNLARTRQPDIVLTDLMMPVMDGLQLVSALKETLATSHIPIVLLTAKEAIESRLDAMKEGADDYITKPFSTLYLKARVENLLAQRRKLQSFYREQLLGSAFSAGHTPDAPETDSMPAPESVLPEQDRRFLEQLTDIMNEQMDNEALTVDTLLYPFHISRTEFFVKLKRLTNLSPQEFITQMRARRAAELILEGQLQMKDIALRVGIGNPHYFSRFFKKVYGMTPMEFKKHNGPDSPSAD